LSSSNVPNLPGLEPDFACYLARDSRFGAKERVSGISHGDLIYRQPNHDLRIQQLRTIASYDSSTILGHSLRLDDLVVEAGVAQGDSSDDNYMMSGALPIIINSATPGYIETRGRSDGPLPLDNRNATTEPAISTSLLRLAHLPPDIQLIGVLTLDSHISPPPHFYSALCNLASIARDGDELIQQYIRHPEELVAQLSLWEDFPGKPASPHKYDTGKTELILHQEYSSAIGEWIEFEGSSPGRRLFWKYDAERDTVLVMAEV
jgi:hypothetical protein